MLRTFIEELEMDVVIFVIGRILNIIRLKFGLESVGVEFFVMGVIKVDEYSRITVSNIWVVGDVIDRVNLILVVFMEGMVFVDIVVRGNLIKLDYENILCVVFF